MLLPKPNKRPRSPTSYHPTCLFNAMGKKAERIIYNRLLFIIKRSNGLSKCLYGSYSTVAKDALNFGGCCAVLTLDVKNAFNSANWN